MPQEFNTIFQFTIPLSEIIQNIFIAFVCGVIISFFYRKTYSGPGYLNSFVNSLVILSMITAVVIMIIGNNLARAFGLVGAMSIIRFRTAVKETQDIIFIFFSLSIGMAAGVGLHGLAFAGTLLVGFTALILTKTNLVSPIQKDLLLQFSFTGNGSDEESKFLDVLNKYCKRIKLINAKSIGDTGTMEYSYYIGFQKKASASEFIRDLKNVKGINQVNVFFDEEYF